MRGAPFTLSPAESTAFREALAEARRVNGWSLKDVSSILGCSRKTAWTHLRANCRVNVRACYANRLASSIPPSKVVWNTTSRVKIGMTALLSDWDRADSPPRRRKWAYRMASFITECAAAYYELPISEVNLKTSFQGNPVELSVRLQVPKTRVYGTIELRLEHGRGPIRLVFSNSDNVVTYEGDLEAKVLPKVFIKIKSWQK